MDMLGRKDASLRALVAELLARLPTGRVIVVDHWDDPFAIGLALVSNPDRLVYINSERDSAGRFYMSRELPTNTDLQPFLEAGDDHYDDLGTFAAAVAAHLGAA